MTRIAIIGGGTSGLMTAYLLERKYKNSIRTTLFEATDRIGGKIMTRRSDSAPVMYEAGVAEIYDYEGLGPNPLRRLIRELGLKTKPIEGQPALLNGKLQRNEHEIKLHFGDATLRAIEDFRKRAASMMPIEMWRKGDWQDDNEHPWVLSAYEELLNEVADSSARKYLTSAAHGDLMTEPNLTSGLNGLKNFVTGTPRYVRQYSIEGGMETLPRTLRESLTATDIELNAPVARVRKNQDESYRVYSRRGREVMSQDFDMVIIALPHNRLSSIEWGSERLRLAIAVNVDYYHLPAHYLRVSILFKTPFWAVLLLAQG